LTPGPSSDLVHGINRSVIVICAQISRDTRPAAPPHCNWVWKHSDDQFYGTVALSRNSFLDRWIDNCLNEINACSTLIPKLSGVAHSSDWRFSLVTLREAHCNDSGAFEWIKHRPYRWIKGKPDANKLTFRHHNHDTWSYRHIGETDAQDGTCSMSCKTENIMEIPTNTNKDGCKVKITGVIILEMEFNGEDKLKKWKTTAKAEWSMTISFTSGHSGQCLNVDVTTVHPKISGIPGFDGDCQEIQSSFKDAVTLLGIEMKQMEEVMTKNGCGKGSIQEELGNRFKGSWHLLHTEAYHYMLCNPLFNSQGDLIIGLQPGYTKKSHGLHHARVKAADHKAIVHHGHDGKVHNGKVHDEKVHVPVHKIIPEVLTPVSATTPIFTHDKQETKHDSPPHKVPVVVAHDKHETKHETPPQNGGHKVPVAVNAPVTHAPNVPVPASPKVVVGANVVPVAGEKGKHANGKVAQ